MTKKRYKTQGVQDLFAGERTRQALMKLNNPLVRLDECIDFELFREPLIKGLYPANRLTSGAPTL